MISSAETAKLPAFTANAYCGGPSSSSAAPSAGPIATTRFWISPSSAFAAARSFSLASCGTRAAVAGEYTTCTVAVTAASAIASQTGAPLAATATIPSCAAHAARSDVTSSRTRSKRSAITPP